MAIKEKVFWQDTVTTPARAAEGPLPERVDTAIIGAGFTGLSAARTLAKAGARVAILEAETIGWGASSRNGGMVLTGLKLPVSKLLKRYGRDRTRRLYAASLASIDCVEEIVRAENIDCDFYRCGHLEVACKPKHFEEFQRSAELVARECGHTVRIIPKNSLSEEIGSGIYHGGLVDDTSAGLNPARYVAGLASAAQKAGAKIFERVRVEKIERDTGGVGEPFRVSTSRGPLWAGHVLAATSGYTGRATPALQKKIVPIGSYIIATDPLPEPLARELSPRNRMIFDSKNYLYYYRLTPDRRMLFGGRARFFPETPQSIRESAEILRRGMVAVYPQLRDVPVAYAWGGTLDFAFDILPHAGALGAVHYALGYAGHGVAMATYMGKIMGEIISGRTHADANPFDGLPFPGAPLGLYNGKPWFLPLAGVWYKILDWLT